MIGAVLVGGKGKRLWPLTEETPKPLLEIKHGVTILDKQLLQFKGVGIKKIYLLVSYLAKDVKARYGNSWKGLRINYINEKTPLGTAGAINNLVKEVEETVVVRNGDIVSDFNLGRMIKKHEKGKLTMFIVPLVSPFGITEISDGKIINFKEKPVLDYYINAGVYIISPELFEYFKVEKGSVEKLVFQKLARKGLINLYKEKCYWKSVDSVKDLEEIRKNLKTGKSQTQKIDNCRDD